MKIIFAQALTAKKERGILYFMKSSGFQDISLCYQT